LASTTTVGTPPQTGSLPLFTVAVTDPLTVGHASLPVGIVKSKSMSKMIPQLGAQLTDSAVVRTFNAMETLGCPSQTAPPLFTVLVMLGMNTGQRAGGIGTFRSKSKSKSVSQLKHAPVLVAAPVTLNVGSAHVFPGVVNTEVSLTVTCKA